MRYRLFGWTLVLAVPLALSIMTVLAVPVSSWPASTWTAVSRLYTQRSLLAAVQGQDGRIYAIAGYTGGCCGADAYLGTVEVYDPPANMWTDVARLSTDGLGAVAATTGPDGRIYVIGGTRLNSTLSDFVSLTTAKAYSPTVNTWTSVAALPGPRFLLGAATGSDRRIYAVGGSDSGSPLQDSTLNYLNRVQAYDSQTDSWTTVASLPTARTALAVAAGSDGRIYAIGGMNASGPLNVVEVYNPSTNIWTAAANMPTPRKHLAAALGADGRIYAIGGSTAAADYVAAVEAYDPATNTWTAVASLPNGGQTRLAAASDSSGAIYAIGGDRGAQGLNIVHVYPPYLTPTPTASATPTATSSATPTTTVTHTPSPTYTPTATPTASASGTVGPAPMLQAVWPNSMPANQTLWVQVSGQNFVSPTLQLDSTLLTATAWVSSTLVQAKIPAGMAAGIYTLTLTNLNGGWTRLTNALTITVPPAPQQLNVGGLTMSNLADASFALSWITNFPARAQVRYGITNTVGLTEMVGLANDAWGVDYFGLTHYVVVGVADPFSGQPSGAYNLDPAATYWFEVLLDGYPVPYYHGLATTGPTLPARTPDGRWGRVTDDQGQPLKGALVYVSLETGSGGRSNMLSTRTDNEGRWYIDLGRARVPDLSTAFAYTSTDQLRLQVDAPPWGRGVQVVSASSVLPANVVVYPVASRTCQFGPGWNVLALPSLLWTRFPR